MSKKKGTLLIILLITAISIAMSGAIMMAFTLSEPKSNIFSIGGFLFLGGVTILAIFRLLT